MPHTYIRGGSNSDLTVTGAIFNKYLRHVAETSVSQTVNVAGGATVTGYAFSEAGEPGPVGSQVGTYTIELDVPTGHANINISVNIARVDSAGVVLAESAYSATQSGSSGQYTFTLTNINLGTWVATDRLRVGYRFNNTNTMNARSVTIAHGSDFNQVIAPFEHPPELVTGLQVTNVTDSSVSLSWTAEPNSTAYDISTTQQGAGGMEFVKQDTGVTGTTFTVTGLAGGVYHEFVIRGTSSFGVSPYSAPVSVTTDLPPVEVSVTLTDSLTVIDSGLWDVVNEADAVPVTDSVTYTKESTGAVTKTGQDGLGVQLTESYMFGQVAAASNDFLTTSLTELRTLHATASSSDGLTVGVTESSVVAISGLVEKQSSDNLGATVGYGKANLVSLTGVDSLATSVSESRTFGTTSIARSDVATLSIAESNAFGTVSVSATDSSSLSIAESVGLFIQRSATDQSTLSVTESATPAVSGEIVKTSSDSLGVTLGHGLLNAVNLTAADNLTVGLTETYSFATQNIVATDSYSVSLTESTGFSTIQVTSADGLHVTVQSVGNFPPIEFADDDSTTLSVNETVDVFVFDSTIDSTDLSVIETSDVVVSGLAVKQSSDNIGVTLGYGIANIVSVLRSDNLAVSLTETFEFGTQQISGSDQTNLTLTETGQFGGVAVVGSDAIELSLLESGLLFVERAASDSFGVTVLESGQTDVSGLLEKQSSDNLGVTVGYGAANVISLTSADNLPVGLTETPQFATVDVTASAATAVSIDDSSGLQLGLAATDALSIDVTESSGALVGGVVEKSSIDTSTLTLGHSVTGAVNITSANVLAVELTELKQFAPVEVRTATVVNLTVESEVDHDIYLDRSDVVGVALSASSVTGLDKSSSDLTTLSVGEGSALGVSGSIELESQDLVTVSLAELSDRSVSLVNIESSDILAVTIGTVPAGYVQHNSADGLILFVDESSSPVAIGSLAISATDELSLFLTEQGQTSTRIPRDITVVISVPQTRSKHTLLAPEKRVATGGTTASPLYELGLLQNRPRATITLETRIVTGAPVIDRS